MADTIVIFDPNQPAGSRFPSAAVRNEIGRTASVEMELADGSVTNPKLAPYAVTGDKMASNTIISRHLTAQSVTETKLADASVSGRTATTGVVTAVNDTGTYVDRVIVTLTAAQYNALDPPDPHTLYFIY